jgi:hypothetical protein
VGTALHKSFFPFQSRIDAYISEFNEFTEMLIGLSGLLFVWLNARRFRTTPVQQTSDVKFG